MTEKEREEIDRLRREIDRHNRLYYVDAAPEISDQEFDALLERLRLLERKYPEAITPDSPTQRVGGQPIEGFRTVEHRVPMLSMDNTYNTAELQSFHSRIVKLLDGQAPVYVAEPKIDGVSISLTYENGLFKLGATRGDGRFGDDVTENLKTIRNLPLKLTGHAPKVLEVRGEVYFPKSGFAALNRQRAEEGEVLYANPRNTAAGTLKLLDPRIVATRPLRLFVYGIGYQEGFDSRSHWETITRLKKLGLPTNPETRRLENFDELVAYITSWEQKRHRLEYEVDGMVVKVDDYRQRELLGATSKFPRWQVAYKYASAQAVTRIRSIDVEVGRTGKLTPVANLEPVQLAGTTVCHASLHNDQEIARKDIRVGDLVVIEKAGEIIPQVVAVKKELRTETLPPFVFPTHCPSCGTAVKRDEGGVYIRCPNAKCPAQFQNLLEAFAKRDAMDIEGLGPAVVEQLIAAGLVTNLADLYRLKEDDVANLERMGKKSARNLIQAIAASKGKGLARLLTGLGIRHVGKRSAELLAQHFGTMEAIVAADDEALSAVPEIGPTIAESIVNYFHVLGGREVVRELAELGVRMDEPTFQAARGDGPLSGKTFVVTGTMKNRTRDEIESAIKAAGGKVSSSVSSKTSFVVAGESAGSKLDKAKKLGVPVLSEEELEAMMHRGGG